MRAKQKASGRAFLAAGACVLAALPGSALAGRPWDALSGAGLAVAAEADPSQGEEVRFAVVVGANQGGASEASLHYASSDAEEVAEVLVELGGVDPSHLELLLSPDAEQVRLALRRVAIAAGQETETGLFLFYYSGHAGFDGLHLGASTLSGNDLRELVEAVPARVRVVIVDACHAGALVYFKGGAPVESFLGVPREATAVEGSAYLLSCGADEKAQESEEYRHSVFTYWLLSGLRGAADFSGDGWVTLPELWDHARSGTALTSTRTRVAQRPTWEVNVRGQQSVKLTNLRASQLTAFLEFPEGGDYWVFRDGTLVAEIYAQLPGHRVAVERGTYLVRRILGDVEIQEGVVELEPGQTAVLSRDSMEDVSYVRLAAKGRGAPNSFRQGPVALMQYRGEMLSGFGGLLGGGLSWPLITGRLWLAPRMLVAASSMDREGVVVDMTEVQLDGAVGLGIEAGPLILRPQVALGGLVSRQAVAGALTDEEPRAALGGQAAAGLALLVAPFDGRAYVELGAEAATYLLRTEPGRGQNPEWEVAPTFRITMGLGYVL